jgi:GT2 family glycosyltransferase
MQTYVSDSRVRTLWFERNGGHPYRRWNDGARLATGEYLMFAGADDSCAPALLEALVRRLDADPTVGIAHARSWVVNSDGTRVRLKPAASRWDADFVATGEQEAPFMLAGNTVPNASAALLRRSAFERCGGFDTSFRLAADYMLWARMLSVSRLAYVAEPLNFYRRHRKTVREREGPSHSLLERYRVVAYIVKTFGVTGQPREDVLEGLAAELVLRFPRTPTARDLRMNRGIYRAARAVDPALGPRLGRLFLRRLRDGVRRRLAGRRPHA